MSQEKFEFVSDGLKLRGIVHLPNDLKKGERRSAFLVLHGFGSNKESGSAARPAEQLAKLGYVALRFDMRGLGESEGEHARVICLEQVADTSNALTALASIQRSIPIASPWSAPASAARLRSMPAAPMSVSPP